MPLSAHDDSTFTGDISLDCLVDSRERAFVKPRITWKPRCRTAARFECACVPRTRSVRQAPSPPPTLSTDATLSALTVYDGATDHIIDLADPPYAQTVDNVVETVTLTATPTHTGASVSAVTVDGTPDTSDTDFTDGITVPALAEGDNEIVVTVTAEDGSTALSYTVTVTRETSTIVTIEAEHEEIGAGLEDLNFTLTRMGDTTEALTAKVIVTQDQTWLGDSDLEHTVTFLAGDATVDLTIVAWKFSFTPSTTGDLTATVRSGDGILGGADTVQVVSTADPPITVGLDMSEYTFAEDATNAEVYVVATLDTAYPRAPSGTIRVNSGASDISVETVSFTATLSQDYAAVDSTVDVLAMDYQQAVGGQYVARELLSGFAIVDDAIYEGSEQFVLNNELDADTNRDMVRLQKPDGTGDEIYYVTITDDEDLPALSLSVHPPSIAEEDDDTTTGVTENASTVTVAITNGKTFAVEQTVTLTFSGGTQGTHFSVSPTDADTTAANYQVVLPVGDSSVDVTFTAAGNDTVDGNRTVSVAGDLDGTAIDTRDITILDDDTTVTNTPATGKPVIEGVAQVDRTLTAEMGDIDDADVLPTTEFPLGYNFLWVRIDASNSETDIGTNSHTYTLDEADEGSTIKVKVSFTDGANNLETVPSDPEGPVVPAAEDCVADRPGNDWCTTMTVGVRTVATTDYAGYEFGSIGSLLDRSIDYGGKSFPVAYLQTSKDISFGNNIEFEIGNDVGFLPRGTVFNFGGEEFTADDASESATDPGVYGWGDPADLTWIEGQEVTVSANLAPAPESATVNGTTLVLTHAEDLDTGSTPAADSYTVNVNGGTGPTVSSVSVGARTVTLTLATPVAATDIVTLDYDAPASSPLQDESGLDAPDAEDFPVTNNTENTAPVVDNPIADQAATVGTEFSYTFPADTFSDADGDTLTYSVHSPDETEWLSYSSATREFVGTPADADVGTITVTVTASDGRGGTVSDAFDIEVSSLPVLSFAQPRVDVNETDGTAALTVNLTPESTGQVAVDYATSDRGAAKAGEDYTAQSGTLTFAPGETSKTITIQITDDDVHEPEELFRVDLTNPSGATVPAGTGSNLYHERRCAAGSVDGQRDRRRRGRHDEADPASSDRPSAPN